LKKKIGLHKKGNLHLQYSNPMLN